MSLFSIVGNRVDNSASINLPNIKASSNRFEVITSGVSQLYIDSQGKVGIGTSNPSQLLHLYQPDSDEVQLKITNSATTNGILLGLTADEDLQLKNRDTGKHIIFGTNDGEDVRIEAGGNVGIGTTNPSELLHINKGDSGSAQLRFTNGGGGNALLGLDSSENLRYYERAGNELQLGQNDLTRAKLNTTGHFEIVGTTNCLLLNSLTTTERDALTGINGMLIYNETLNKFQGYENSAWVNLV